MEDPLGIISEEEKHQGDPLNLLTDAEKRKPHGVTGSFAKPTIGERVESGLRAVGTVASGIALLPGAGIMGASEALPTFTRPASLQRGAAKIEEIAGFPGKHLIKTPEQAELAEKIGGTIGKPFEMAGKGWGLIGKELNETVAMHYGVDPEDSALEPFLATIGEASAIFGLGARLFKQKFNEFKGGLSAKTTEARLRAGEAKYGKVAVVPERMIAELPEPKIAPLAPESEYVKGEFQERFKKPEEVKLVKGKAKPEPERHRSYLPMLLDEVMEGGPPEILKFEGEYGHAEYRRTGSTYPEWMKNQGWTGKEVTIALQKGMKGEKLGPRQETIFNSALSEARERFLRDAKEHGRIRKEAIEEAKANGIEERDLQESIQREAAEEIAREAEFAKLEREAIQAESERITKEDISFKSEEIEPAEKPKPIPAEKSPADEPPIQLHALPLPELGKQWTKYIGKPIWDKVVMKKVPKLLEKVPGGKAVNRALLYDYRGDLPNTAKYIKSMEDMRRFQAVGREYAIDLGKRLQAVPEKQQLMLGEYIRGELEDLPKNLKALGDEAKRSLYDLGKQATEQGLLSEETFFKHAGRYMPRLYTSKEYQSLLTQYRLTKPNRLDLSRFKRRKDIPKEIREEMGEILTPGYPVAKGITQLTHDVEMARFFSGVASNKEWALPKNILKVESKEGVKMAIPEGWKQLPSNKKLGKLSEAYVHPEIFKDLQETIRVMETPEKVWRKSLGAWKFGKVILSPKTYMRNLMSNSVLAHLGGLPMYEQPIYLVKAAKAMKTKSEYWKIAREEGIFRHTFTEGELRDLFDKVDSEMGGIKAGSIPEALGRIGQGWALTKKTGRRAADLYQAEEQIFKMAKLIHNMERKGMKAHEAAMDAEKWLFNYSKLTKFQEKYRSKWYGAPFATFTFKALPRMAEAMVKTPWRFALPAAIIYALEEAAQRKIGDTDEEIKAKKALRPEWQQGTLLGIPNFARTPVVDDNGREYYLNLTYILPWGDIAEQGGKFGIPGSLMPFSQPFVKEPISQIMNYDPFWEEKIVKETDVAGLPKGEQIATEAKLRAGHAARSILPTLYTDVTKAISSLRGKPDYKGRFRPRGVVLADILAGVKLYPVDYVERAEQEINKLHPKHGVIAREILGQIKTLSRKKQAMEKTGGNVTFYQEQIERKIKQLVGLAAKTEEVGEVFRKLRIHKKENTAKNK